MSSKVSEERVPGDLEEVIVQRVHRFDLGRPEQLVIGHSLEEIVRKVQPFRRHDSTSNFYPPSQKTTAIRP